MPEDTAPAPSATPEWPRLTPYELAFAAPVFEEDQFPAIAEEAEGRGARAGEPDAFVMLATAGRLLRRLMPEDAEDPEEAAGPAHGELFTRFGQLLHHAWHFWRHGRRLFYLERGVARWLVEARPGPRDWALTAPSPAGYLQLPRHLFWSAPEEGATPEPVDGFFWTLMGADAPAQPPYARIDLLLVTGMRPGRPGFGSVAVAGRTAEVPGGHWAAAAGRPEGRDFSTLLPGGDLGELYSIQTPMEALKLASLCFWHMERQADALREEAPAPEEDDGGPHALPPSALPYHRIRLSP